MIRWLENHYTYHPDQVRYSDLSKFGLTQVWLEPTKDVRIDCRFKILRADRCIIFSHGNTGNISNYSWYSSFFESLGYSYVLYDYPKYGESTGDLCEANCYLSLEAVYNETRKRFSADQIVFFGLSLGGAVTAEIASRSPSRAVILEAVFTSTRYMARKILRGLPFHVFAPNRYNTEDKIDRISAPKLLIHGRRDEVVPFECSEILFKKATEPKYFYRLDQAGHSDCAAVGGARYTEVIQRFVEELSLNQDDLRG